MSRALIALLCLAGFGCGGEPSSTERAAPPAEAQPAPAQAPELGSPPAARVSVLAFGAGSAPIRLPMLPVAVERERRELPEWGPPGERWPRITHPDEATNTWLAEAARSQLDVFARDTGEEVEAEDASLGGRRCTATLAHTELFSVTCNGYLDYFRGMPGTAIGAMNYAIVEDHLERFELRDALAPHVQLDPLIRAACLPAMREESARDESDRVSARDRCRGVPERARLALTEEGVRAVFLCSDLGIEPDRRICRGTIPYRSLDRRILADSPLGRALAALEGVEAVEIELPPGAETGEQTSGFAASSEARLNAVLTRWRRLPPELRVGLVVVARGERRAVLAHADEARARAVAEATGAETSALSWTHALRPFVGRRRHAPRAWRDQFDARYIPWAEPRGTIVTFLRGRLGGRASDIGDRENMVYVASSEALGRWVAGAAVEAHEGCVPDAAEFIDGMPEDRRARARMTLRVAVTDALRAGRRRPLVAFSALTAPVNRRRAGALRLDIHELGEECAVGRRVARVDTEGAPLTWFLTHTTPHGGEPLLVLGAHVRRAPGTEGYAEWTVRRLGEDAVLHRVSRDGRDIQRAGVSEGGEWFPLVVRTGEEGSPEHWVRWTGDQLEVRAGPTAESSDEAATGSAEEAETAAE